MAVRKPYRKTNQKKQSQGSQSIVIFWLVFVIVIISVFMINSETIKKNFDLFKTRVTTSPGTEMEEDLPEEVNITGEAVIQEQIPERNTERNSGQTVVVTDNTSRPAVEPERPPANTQTQTQSTQPQQQQTQTQTQTVQTRERPVYFTHIDKDGQILQSRVIRRVPVSETPMQDALNILLSGPSAEELNRGILNLIPQNTRMLSAVVRGNTAYISFSEDFLFNTFGVEGYVAQLRQIVWTVTEFPNVNDVQILIEGRRFDYLGEGIYIGSPISRQSF